MTARAWTDYPIAELGDRLGEEAPIREVEAVSFDGDKYVLVRVPGLAYPIEIKRGYVYAAPGRYGEAPWFDEDSLPVVPFPMDNGRGDEGWKP
mgnify:CR=1 FL=1